MRKCSSRIKTFWVVRDPSPESILSDVLFETSVDQFAAYCLGVGRLAQFKLERHALYDNANEARRDAEQRLAAMKQSLVLAARVAHRAVASGS